MNLRLKIAAAAMVAASVVACYGQTSEAKPAVKKHVATRAAKDPAPTVAEQIRALKEELEGQINSLKSDLAEKDAQLQKAQQAAADAQASAAKAEAAANAQQQAVTENNTAVTTLQSAVTDLKSGQASLATTVSDETSAIKKSLAAPAAIHYKGINITPGGFVAGETVWRSKATGGDIPTAFSAIPYEGADAYSLSEFYGSARQSRITMLAEGKTSWGTLRGYYEADFLGTGITSNNNQSNSYVLRQRILYAEAKTNSNWTVAGGQLWSLATEQKKGITSAPSDVLTPLTIDPNYVTGFVWTRQYGFRVVKSFAGDKAAFGVAVENPQLLYTASIAGNTPYAVLGSAGTNGGNYNAAISGISSVAPYIQNYVAEPGTSGLAGVTPVDQIVTNTVIANSNIANISFNQAPDIIAKLALDPGFGHYELFGIAGFAHETVYPGVTTNSVKFGGKDANGNTITDIFTGTAPTVLTYTGTTVALASSTTSGSYVNSIMLGGFGASARVPVIKDKLTIGAKGLYGPGMGRYGDSTLADVTSDTNGDLAPIHNLSGLFTVEATPTPRLVVFLNYGGDYAGRTDFGTGSTVASTLGSPTAYFCPIGYTTANAATTCIKAANVTNAELAAGGTWGAHWATPAAGTTAVGYGSRLLSNSGCTSIANPGYNGSGFLPGGSCGAQTRDVQEITGGYWFDFYKGDRGRFRQGFQYGYAVREGWSGVGGIGAKGIDNMIWTSLRYYLP
jgi:Skp family chaperone for outer membrane proteins